MARTVRDEITYPCPHFEGCIVEVLVWINDLIPLYNRRNLLSMLGLKFILVSKRGPLGIRDRNQIGKAINGF